ncbi:MAG TPA: cell division protein ZapA [Gammaproteobacteria bacterium]
MSSVAITVNILDRDYQIACKTDEKEILLASARFLDQKMREIRDRGNVIGIDRIAVMAALNIAHEFLQLKPLEEEQRTIALQISKLKRTIAEIVGAEHRNQPELI